MKLAGTYDPMKAPKIEKPLLATLILHDEGDKEERKEYIEEFKKKQGLQLYL